MKKETVPYTSEADWLAARARDVTSTESSALFEANPYTTAFELYHRKRESYVVERDDNERMRWGRRLQDSIAHGVAEDCNVIALPMKEYVRAPDERIGSSFDYRIVSAHSGPFREKLGAHGPGLMEIKTVDLFAFKDGWVIDAGEVVEAPPHIELQVQHQMLVSGLQWALIVALVGGNRVSKIERAYDPEIGRAILRKVQEFWQLVDAGTAPLPDYTRDAALIAKQHVESIAGKVLDARADIDLNEWVLRHRELGQEISTRSKERDELRARILERVGDASKAMLPDYGVLSCGTVREAEVPAYTRAAYRNLRFTPRKV